MRLSTKTRYGVRAVFDIAYHAAPDGTAAQAKEVAKRQRIPLRYLEQIFQDLKKAGLVESKRGPRGGYTLRRDPADIRLGDIVRALQGPIESLIVVEDEPVRTRGRGITSDLWQDLAAHVNAWFDGVSVMDLVRKAEQQGVPRAGAPSPMYFI
ncbi:MAG TPA: Rrf2 family transcriptional regulator [Kofleriaceae bacterium]|nr:Rrf2 family transcriptional regulator [Kofleriaceae bacterium]